MSRPTPLRAACACGLALLALLRPLPLRAGPTGPEMNVAGVPLGSGVPVPAGTPAPRLAAPVAGGDYHVPNYLPGHPTAATLWPRMAYVPCRRDEATSALDCGGYDVTPLRGEYVYVRPVVLPSPPAPPPAPAMPPAAEPPPPVIAPPAPVRKKPLE